MKKYLLYIVIVIMSVILSLVYTYYIANSDMDLWLKFFLLG